jgi:hypothetical protein
MGIRRWRGCAFGGVSAGLSRLGDWGRGLIAGSVVLAGLARGGSLFHLGMTMNVLAYCCLATFFMLSLFLGSFSSCFF